MISKEEIRQLVIVMADIDFQEHDDFMGIKLGGEGDNGEQLIVLLEKAMPLIGYAIGDSGDTAGGGDE